MELPNLLSITWMSLKKEKEKLCFQGGVYQCCLNSMQLFLMLTKASLSMLFYNCSDMHCDVFTELKR